MHKLYIRENLIAKHTSMRGGLRGNFFLASASYLRIVHLAEIAIFSSAYSYCISARFQMLSVLKTIRYKHDIEILLYVTLLYVQPNFVLLISTPEPRFSFQKLGSRVNASWRTINGDFPGRSSQRGTCCF